MYTTIETTEIKTHDGKVVIEIAIREEILTDSSKAYNVTTEFKTNFKEFKRTLSGHSTPIKLVDTSGADYDEAFKIYMIICRGLTVLEESEKQ